MVFYSFYYYFLILVEVTWTEQYDLNLQGSKRASKWLEKFQPLLKETGNSLMYVKTPLFFNSISFDDI